MNRSTVLTALGIVALFGAGGYWLAQRAVVGPTLPAGTASGKQDRDDEQVLVDDEPGRKEADATPIPAPKRYPMLRAVDAETLAPLQDYSLVAHGEGRQVLGRHARGEDGGIRLDMTADLIEVQAPDYYPAYYHPLPRIDTTAALHRRDIVSGQVVHAPDDFGPLDRLRVELRYTDLGFFAEAKLRSWTAETVPVRSDGTFRFPSSWRRRGDLVLYHTDGRSLRGEPMMSRPWAPGVVFVEFDLATHPEPDIVGPLHVVVSYPGGMTGRFHVELLDAKTRVAATHQLSGEFAADGASVKLGFDRVPAGTWVPCIQAMMRTYQFPPAAVMSDGQVLELVIPAGGQIVLVLEGVDPQRIDVAKAPLFARVFDKEGFPLTTMHAVKGTTELPIDRIPPGDWLVQLFAPTLALQSEPLAVRVEAGTSSSRVVAMKPAHTVVVELAEGVNGVLVRHVASGLVRHRLPPPAAGRITEQLVGGSYEVQVAIAAGGPWSAPRRFLVTGDATWDLR